MGKAQLTEALETRKRKELIPLNAKKIDKKRVKRVKTEIETGKEKKKKRNRYAKKKRRTKEREA